MRKSSARGTSISTTEVEILGLTPHALWLLVGGREYMLDYRRFPWFQDASMRDLRQVELRFDHLHWPTLDVDLHVDSLAEPERFPLVSKAKRSVGLRIRRP